MKKPSLIALVGVCLFLINNLCYIFVPYLWGYFWYDTMEKVFQILAFVGWICIGQFFLQLYKKSK